MCLFIVPSTYVSTDSGNAVWSLMASRERERESFERKKIIEDGTNKLKIIVRRKIYEKKRRTIL